MPYESVADLPAAIRKKYGSCAKAFVGAFNSTYEKSGEARAFAVAHAAAQRCQRKESSMTLDPTAAVPEEEVPGPKFRIITKALQGAMPDEKDTSRRRFKATASSTIIDMAGDEIEMPALEKMAQQFREGRTIFMNHKWRDVEEAFGLTDSAEVIQRGFDPKTNKPIYDLDIGGVVNTPNPKAVRLADSIDGGFVKLGASVTAIVRKHRRKSEGGMAISDVDVIEASIVGVPENQRSWAQKAATAIKGFGHVDSFDIDEDDEEETVSDEVIEKGMDAPEKTPNPDVASPDVTEDNDNEKTDDAADTAAPVEAPAPEPESDESATSDGQESASAGETPETASDGDSAEEQFADSPVTEKAYDPADVRELVQKAVLLATQIGQLNEVIIQKDADIAALNAKVAQYEGEAGALTDEVDTAAEVIRKALDLPLRPRAQAVIEETASSTLWNNHPAIAEYLNKRRHLSE